MVVTYYSQGPVDVPFVVEVPVSKLCIDREEMTLWLWDNVGVEGKDWFYVVDAISGMRFQHSDKILFMDEEVAMAFKLAWG